MALDGTTAILETRLLPKEELYKRWIGATHEEIADHFNKGELRAYERHKGPINSIIWCKPGHVYYQSQVSYSNPDLYDYNDDSCDYFLLEDVMRCETEHPEYTGNVTPESLGLAQDGALGVPEEEPEYIKAESLRKEMRLSPVQFVDYLRENQELAFFGNGVDDGSRNWFYQTASREQAADMLEDMYIHRLDIEAHKRRIAEVTSIPPVPVADSNASPMADIPFPTVAVNTSGLESQLAEAQKKIEDVEGVRRWNKQFLTERAELQTALTEKDARLAELEKELAAAREKIAALEASNTELSTTTRTQAATEARQDKTLGNWQAAFKIMIPVIMQCHTDGPKKRTKTELQSMCSKHGGKLTDTQLDFLRGILGGKHVNMTGGATVQG